jgi:hypothetical protein
MEKFLHHPVRVALTLAAFLCALSAFTFFGAPWMLAPFIPLTFGFIASKKRSSMVVGWIFLFLVIACFINGQIKIDGFRFEKLVIYGVPSLLLLASLHLHVSESRKNRTMNTKHLANKPDNPPN